MRIIKIKRVREWMAAHAAARPSLREWVKRTRAARWRDFNDLRRTFPRADQVRVASDRTVIVFNVGGNNFRLVGAVHFNTGIVFVLRFMTHADYDDDRWKDTL